MLLPFTSRVNILAKKPYFFLNRDIPDPYFFLDFTVRAKRVYYSWGSGGRRKPPSGVQGLSPGKFLYFTPENRPFGHDLGSICKFFGLEMGFSVNIIEKILSLFPPYFILILSLFLPGFSKSLLIPPPPRESGQNIYPWERNIPKGWFAKLNYHKTIMRL